MHKDNYIYKKNYLTDVVPDQTIIFKKRFFHHHPGVKEVKAPKDDSFPFDREMLDSRDWHPAVNSYYSFTEDVDAFARVHSLVETRRSTDSLEKEDTVKVNEYSDQRALNQYLRSKPMSFLILGKPNLGEDLLGKRLAEFWNCAYIDPLTLLEEEIASDSRPGQCIEFNLRSGRAIGVDILTRLLVKKAQSPYVLHRGFVCCGFPLIPNDLYEEDPISSESAVFNVKEIFEDIFDQAVRAIDVSTKVVVSMAGSSKDEMEKDSEMEDSGMVLTVPVSSANIAMEWSLENQVCGPSDISSDLEKQLSCIFGLFEDPYMIIYILGKNSDVVSKRDNYYFDVYSNKYLDMQKIRMFYEQGGASDELTKDLFDSGGNPFSENPTLKHIVKLPENFPANVNAQLDRYHSEVANILDFRVLMHSPQYYLKVDGRSFISQMMKEIELRLKILSVQGVISAQPFFTPYEEVGEGVEPSDIEKMTPEEAFSALSRQYIPQPVFKWTWSNWRTYCPVSMVRGVYQKGLPKYAVHFANKIFFMANERNFYKFIENPRDYLLPHFPKPGSSIFVFGPPVSGKSAVAKCLGYLLNSKVITSEEIRKAYFAEVMEEYTEQVKQIAIAEALEILKEKLATEEEERQDQIGQWKEYVTERLKKLNALLTSRQERYQQISSFPMMMGQEGVAEKKSIHEESEVRKDLEAVNIPRDIDQEFCSILLGSEASLIQFLPESLKKEISTPSVLDPFVLEYANRKVEAIENDVIKHKVQENLVEMYTRCIRSILQESEHACCVIDDMTTNVTLLRNVCEEFNTQDVIILTAPNYNFLIERFKAGSKNVTTFRNFREFFIGIKEPDAAWRVPSDISTESYKHEMATELIDQLITEMFPAEVIENELLSSVEQYQEALTRYDEEIKEVLKVLEGMDIKPICIDINEAPMENLLKEVVTALRDKYRTGASEFTEADRSEEIQQFLAQISEAAGVEGEGGKSLPDDILAANRRYGDSYFYDPVLFSSKFVLWRGKEKFAAKFKDKVYLFGSQENLNRFIKAPRKYLLMYEPPNRFPPPRICVVGSNVELKTKVAKELARNVGARYLDYNRIESYAVNALSSLSLLFEPEGDDALSDSLLFGFYDMVFSRIWFEEPYKYVGFVLDGFPIKPHDLTYMVSSGAIPDSIIFVHMTAEQNLKVELEKMLTEWRLKMDQHRKEEEAINSIILSEWESQRKARYNELIDIKRENRYSKKIFQGSGESGLPQIEEQPNEGGFLSDTQISVDSVIEQQEHDEVMKILDEELPEPVLETTTQSEEEITKTFEAEIEEAYNRNAAYFQEIKKVCDDELIPFVEINGHQELEKILRHSYIIGNEAKFRNDSFFERCYDVSMDVAEKLIESGYFFVSNFGRYCPVQSYNEENPLHMYISSQGRHEIFPVIHRQYIYFIQGKRNRAAFFRNPLRYTISKLRNVTIIPVRVSIIGPPKSGKSTLAKRFERDLGFRTVTRGQAIRYVLSNPMYSNLIAQVEDCLRKGEELPDDLVMECVDAATFCGEAVSQGLVLDGFPNTISEMNVMSRLGLVPHLIFDLQITEKALHKQAAKPSHHTPQYSKRFIDHLLKKWKKDQELFRVWCDREYQSIYKLPIDRSIWGVWEHAKEVTLASIFERKHYYEHFKYDWPLRVGYMLVTPLEFLERQSVYKTYCPGCVYYGRKLNNGGSPPDRTGLVHYRKYFYWLCEQHIEEFLKNTDKFLPPCNDTLPEDLPEIVPPTEKPGSYAEDGYCLVCYHGNFPKKLLVKGVPQYAVRYQDKVFLFDKAECMNAFMHIPYKFGHMVINFKESIPISLEYKDLPVLGMLEQYVARTLVRAVNQTNVYRPVIPGLSISQAALILIGLNLKVHNPRTSYLEQYEEALQIFHKKRLDLVRYLDVMKKYLNPLVHYEEPDPPELGDSFEEEPHFDFSPF